MTSDDSELFAESLGPWRLSFLRLPSEEGGSPTAVQIERDGKAHVRLVLAKRNLSESKAADALRVRAREWIDDYESRTHSGDTGFASL